ncbi:MAG: bifunctional glutamate N-acetyltransferase/amino-acid acetyltransferase ArgJ [Desulfovibrionaceae bacterium]|nr:bifunctional glutamate N-acetyltransferase/amino-acid acetyltransferase ArgJ [Desulfovibrionaceae bacterium]
MACDLPQGFEASACACGFKQQDRDDLGLILSETPCTLAALFTQNRFCAEPVKVCKEILAAKKPVRAIIANSGQANACTGTLGALNVKACQKMVAENFACAVDEVLPLSTGVIGAQLKMDLWMQGIEHLKANLGTRDAEGFTRAIMTTDAFPKFASEVVACSQGSVRLTVMAKGAGMICPNMATMLCVCLTDASVNQEQWQEMFGQAVNLTFNRVSVDGDTSTNDTILGLANGASKVDISNPDDLRKFSKALQRLLGRVAHMLVQDGEGATKVLHIKVTGAIDDHNAEVVARTVGHSQLVKTAIYGGDANWADYC